MLVSFEANPEHTVVAKPNIARAGLPQEVDIRVGEALGLDLLWLDVLERNTQATCFYLEHGFKFLGKESLQTDRRRKSCW